MEAIKKYAQIRAKQALLEEERRELEPSVVKELKELGETKYETSKGLVSVSISKSYEYSDKVAKAQAVYEMEKSKLDDILKRKKLPVELLKIEEEKKGIAKCTETPKVNFKKITK